MNPTAGIALIVDLLAMIVMIVAVARLATADVDRFAHGRLSKAIWIVTALCFVWNTRLGDLPIGAGLALWRLSTTPRQATPTQSLDVPFAEGTPGPFETEEQS